MGHWLQELWSLICPHSSDSFPHFVPHSAQPHVCCCPSPWKDSSWGLASQGPAGSSLVWLILRAVPASAQNCRRNPWSRRNEARSRGLFLRGKRKTHPTVHVWLNQYLDLRLETKAEPGQAVEGHSKTSLTHSTILSLPDVQGKRIYSLT